MYYFWERKVIVRTTVRIFSIIALLFGILLCILALFGGGILSKVLTVSPGVLMFVIGIRGAAISPNDRDYIRRLAMIRTLSIITIALLAPFFDQAFTWVVVGIMAGCLIPSVLLLKQARQTTDKL